MILVIQFLQNQFSNFQLYFICILGVIVVFGCFLRISVPSVHFAVFASLDLFIVILPKIGLDPYMNAFSFIRVVIFLKSVTGTIVMCVYHWGVRYNHLFWCYFWKLQCFHHCEASIWLFTFNLNFRFPMRSGSLMVEIRYRTLSPIGIDLLGVFSLFCFIGLRYTLSSLYRSRTLREFLLLKQCIFQLIPIECGVQGNFIVYTVRLIMSG